jgi:hypothetical protein
MRWLIGCLMLVLLSVAASGQPEETVTVDKDRGLVGLWRIEVPEYFNVNLFQNAHFGPLRPIYCRVEESSDIHCLSGGYSAHGIATRDGNKVHFAWGSAMARMAIDADLTSDGFAGTFTFKLSGIRHDAPTTSTATRVSGITHAQSINATSDSNLLNTDVGGVVASALPDLGSIAQIAYLGTSPNLQGGDSDYFRVYALEFEKGERICGAHGQDPLKCI